MDIVTPDLRQLVDAITNKNRHRNVWENMTTIDPIELLREMLRKTEAVIRSCDEDKRRYERERIALMAAIGALERELTK